MKTLIACALLVGLLTTCATVHAAPPPVYPGEALAESKFPIVMAEGPDCVVAWFYDGKHKWVKTGFFGTGEDCTKARPAVMETLGLDLNDLPSWVLSAAVGATMMKLSHEEKDALWNAVFNIHPGDADYEQVKAENAALDAGAKALFDAIPYPTSAPPSGLVTQSATAYKCSEGINTCTPKAIGTVPLGTECNVMRAVYDAAGKRYYALVDRNLVTMTKVNNLTPVKPTTAYGICDQ